nr:DUF4381 domain-containing protein [uncultured Roseateles sp.]
MSPASQPDAQAQAVLDQLHPLLEPTAPAWSPQTPGWAVVAALFAALLLWLAWRAGQRWWAGRYRRLALAELAELKRGLLSTGAAPGAAPSAAQIAAAARLPELVRRLALAHAPRETVASLQGEAWANWLDRSLPSEARAFSLGAGRSLVDWAYRPATDLHWQELEALLSLLERWIRQHRVPKAEP